MLTEPEQDKSRDFICPCGKGYFSYAALFTHVKQKHNGKAPGQIIKPKPEHKRGRPRKTQIPLHPAPPHPYSAANSEPRICSSEECLPASNLNQIGNNIKFITGPVPLRSSPGSQFKSYRAESTQEPTLHELPNENAPEVSLLEDLTSNLVRLSPAKTPGQGLKEIEARRLLGDGEGGELVECLSGFISFCREGLREDIAGQIELLVTVLLQHVCERQQGEGEDIKTLKHIHLNDHIESFFDRLQAYAKRWRLSGQPIFQGLNPMKILVVLYNWINSVYNIPVQSKEDARGAASEESAGASQKQISQQEGLSLSC